MVAALQQRHGGGEDRRHAGGGGDAGPGALERGEAVLEHRNGGGGEARVDEAALAAGEARSRLLGVVENEARGEEQRLGVLVELGARLPGAHAQRCQIRLFFHKKTRPHLRTKRTGSFSARFSGIYYAPASCGSNRREKVSISGREVQIELCAFGVVPRVARGIPPDLDVAQVVAGDIPRDVVPVEARGLEVLQLRIGAAYSGLQAIAVLVDERLGVELSRHLLLAAMRGDQ